MEDEAPGAVFVEPEGAAAGVVLGAVWIGADEDVGGQGDGVYDGAGVKSEIWRGENTEGFAIGMEVEASVLHIVI